MKAKNILDGSPYRFDWLVWWIRGIPGVVIIIVALAILAALAGWHFFSQYTEAERSNVVAPVTQSAAPLAITQPVAPTVTQDKTDVLDHPKAVKKTGKHYSGEAAEIVADNSESTTLTEKGESETSTIESKSSVRATEWPSIAQPAADYESSVNRYIKNVENQSKINDEIVKKMNGG